VNAEVRGYPLHIARTNNPPPHVSIRITVYNFSLVEDGHRFETTVQMLTNPLFYWLAQNQEVPTYPAAERD